MKKAISAIMAVLLCGFVLTACNNHHENSPADYVSKSGRCVVSLPEDYSIVYENGEDESSTFDENLYNADTVNGKPKKDGVDYYSVLCNTPFRIFMPREVIVEKYENNQTLVYWKLNSTLYKDRQGSYSENTFTCVQDTEIIPLFFEFRPVGMIIIAADENDSPVLSESEIFDEYGNIKVQNGVHYFYGVYDFEPQKEVWKTNLILDEFDISYKVEPVAINFSKRKYTIGIKMKKGTIFDKGSIIVDSLLKIDGHGYMLGKGAGNLLKGEDVTHTFICSIGEHQMKYTFVD